MVEIKGKKVLIVGSSAVEYSLAKKLSKLESVEKIVVAPGNEAMKDFCTCIDIREDNVQELLEFVLENAIDLTICSNEKAIKADIASIFHANQQMIFAPSAQSANICTSKSAGKKFMYKNRIPCSKFGVFEKQSMAIDYIKNSKMPIVIKTDEHQGEKGVLICQSSQIAHAFINSLFESGEKKVVIEDFVLGHEFSFYVITDGYHALPLGSVANYKYALEGNGGLVTPGEGSFVPDYKVSKQVEERILKQIIYPTLNSLAHQQTPYVGILGVDCVLTSQDKIFALEFNSFLQTPDAQGIFAVLNEDLFHLMQACVVGSFADDYETLDIEDSYAVSCVLSSNKKECSIIYGLEDLDEDTHLSHLNTGKNDNFEIVSRGGRTLVVTRTARTLARAVETMYDEISLINFEGKKFRKDIGARIVE